MDSCQVPVPGPRREPDPLRRWVDGCRTADVSPGGAVVLRFGVVPNQEGWMGLSVKRILVGKPIASSEEQHQRLGRPTALAVFASDAISSTAYATEEILFVLMAAVVYPDFYKYLIPLGIVAVILLAIVATSYRQTIFAYPDGGGAYVVSRENINQTSALVAGASLLVDYTLTVAVS